MGCKLRASGREQIRKSDLQGGNGHDVLLCNVLLSDIRFPDWPLCSGGQNEKLPALLRWMRSEMLTLTAWKLTEKGASGLFCFGL